MNKKNNQISPFAQYDGSPFEVGDDSPGTITKEKPTLVKTKYGFYQFSPLPSKEEMQEYYSQKYYQEGRGSYETSYTNEEIKYFKLKASLIYQKLERLHDMAANKRVLDIGCGEGWILDRFVNEGHKAEGIDFSEYGLKTFNPQLLPHLKQGDCIELINEAIQNKNLYDIVLLGNVIEHVLDPVDLLTRIDQILVDGGILVIVAPNDFSPLQEHLMEKEVINAPFWVCYPDHISYFNKTSMENLLQDKGFTVESVVADNPIDMNLLNRNSDYINEPQKGKNTHYFRVDVDNFLATMGEDKLLDLYETLGSMGVGRDLTYYCSK